MKSNLAYHDAQTISGFCSTAPHLGQPTVATRPYGDFQRAIERPSFFFHSCNPNDFFRGITVTSSRVGGMQTTSTTTVSLAKFVAVTAQDENNETVKLQCISAMKEYEDMSLEVNSCLLGQSVIIFVIIFYFLLLCPRYKLLYMLPLRCPMQRGYSASLFS